ncbi:MAG: hypothetical protein BWX70_01663 [Verrucomicrobia bacterium ADurb.Bin070]|nr:MAG: hypothetical protein BWX70_01663 [Verrucomicrobia bacterium ADurb.Bin070]
MPMIDTHMAATYCQVAASSGTATLHIIITALTVMTTLCARFTDQPRCCSQLASEPPASVPTSAARKGIHVSSPAAVTDSPLSSTR